MIFFLAKVLFTSVIIVLVSEVAKKNDALGGMIAALPLTTFLIIIWLYFEGASESKISNHMKYTLYFVLPTLPMFFIFPHIIKKFGFQLSLFFSILITIICIYIFNFIYKQLGFKIF